MHPRQAEIAVIGAGPAGLAAALTLSRAGRPVALLERASVVGGISRTVSFEGMRFDIGGHRFFTRHDGIRAIWEELLGPDLLLRPRMSRILYGGRLYDYPLRPAQALRQLGPVEAARCVADFGRRRLRPARPETSFEDWVSNRFGRRLYEIFFRSYTEKVWGIPGSGISADWASQRIRGLSLAELLATAAGLRRERRATSLVDRFQYPRLGVGMLAERMAEETVAAGSGLHTGREVCELHTDAEGRIRELVTRSPGGQRRRLAVEQVISSMPLPSLVRALRPAPPAAVLDAAAKLRFRHLITVNLAVRGRELFPDNWVYVHDQALQVARIQNFESWSPAMAAPGRSPLCLEYYASDGDTLWTMEERELVALATRELAASGLCRAEVLAGQALRTPRAYPIYDIGYERHLERIRGWLRRIPNLQLMGRYGMFRYNNADHSLLTGVLCAENLLGASHDVWTATAEQGYLEQGRVP